MRTPTAAAAATALPSDDEEGEEEDDCSSNCFRRRAALGVTVRGVLDSRRLWVAVRLEEAGAGVEEVEKERRDDEEAPGKVRGEGEE